MSGAVEHIAWPYNLLMGGTRVVEHGGKRYLIDYDRLLPEWERDLSPWRRIRRMRYGAAGIIDPLDRAASAGTGGQP